MVRPFLQRGGMPRGNMGQFRIRGGGVAKPLFPMGPPFRHFGRVLRGPLGFRRPVGPHERLPPPLLHPLEGEEFPIIRRGLFRRGHGGPPPPLMPPYHENFDPNDEDEDTSFHEFSEPPVPLLVHARLSRPSRGIPFRGRGMPMPLMPGGGHMPPPLGLPMGPMPMRGRGFPMEHPRGLRPMLPRGRGIPFFGIGPPPMMRGGMPPMMRGGFIPPQGRGDKFGGRGSFRGAQHVRRGLLSSNGIHPNDLLALERAKMKELAHPWVTDAMRNEIRKKHRLYQKFKRTHNPSDHTEFKEQRNKVNTMLREAKLEYIGAHPDEDVTKILLEASLVRTARRQSKQQDKESLEDTGTEQSAAAEEDATVEDIIDEDALDYDEDVDDDNDLDLVSEHLRDVEVTVEGEVEESEVLEPKAPEVIERDYLDGVVEESEEEENI